MSQFEVGQWYEAWAGEKFGWSHVVSVKVLGRKGDYVSLEDEYGDSYRKKVKSSVDNRNGFGQYEYFRIKEHDAEFRSYNGLNSCG